MRRCIEQFNGLVSLSPFRSWPICTINTSGYDYRKGQLEDRDFDELFTTNKPVIFAFHGYPAIIHKLTYRRHNHDNIHVRGYKEEGTTTTPFDMVVLNNLDRYQLALDAIQRIPRLRDQMEKATARYWSTMERHKLYVSEHGEDMPEVQNWRWPS
jgi:xylulose-5-phosphate/fructose-6-phosphate phosphoketolase